MRECRELSSHNLLLEIFENNSRETFGENVSQLFDCVDFVQLNISLENFLAKPNCLDCLILALKSKLWRQSLSQHQCSWIVFMDGDIHGRISNRKIDGLSQWTNHVIDGKQLSAACRKSNDFWLPSWIELSLFAILIDTTRDTLQKWWWIQCGSWHKRDLYDPHDRTSLQSWHQDMHQFCKHHLRGSWPFHGQKFAWDNNLCVSRLTHADV